MLSAAAGREAQTPCWLLGPLRRAPRLCPAGLGEQLCATRPTGDLHPSPRPPRPPRAEEEGACSRPPACAHTPAHFPAVSPSHSSETRKAQLLPGPLGPSKTQGHSSVWKQQPDVSTAWKGPAPAPRCTPTQLTTPWTPRGHRPRELGRSHPVSLPRRGPASTPSSPCRQPEERFEVRCLLTSSHSWLGADPA